MDFDDGRLYTLLAAYGADYDAVFAGSAPADDWKRRFADDYRRALADVDPTELGPEELERVIDPLLAERSYLDGSAADAFSVTTGNRLRSLRRATVDNRAGAAPVLSGLFDERRPLDGRLRAFMSFYDSRIEEAGARIENGTSSVSSAPLLGIATSMLTFYAPTEYVAYKFGRFRSFFDAYSDYDVRTASSVDVVEQYGDLNPACATIRDRLAEHVDEPTMLDVWNVIQRHESLDEVAEEGPGDRGGHRPVGPDRPPRAEELAAQLESAGQVILYGPPGTSKTWTATRFARWWIAQDDQYGTGSYETVTFHPSYTYEDFVEGLTAESDDGAVSYEMRDGTFKQFLTAADEAYEATPDGETPPRYVLVVDEINRGNVASIFGELITALELDKRKDRRHELAVELAHSDDSLVVPPNLYLVGTMNTADRSIAMVDAALRRRFRFLSFPPDYELLRDRYGFDDREAVTDAAASDEPTAEALAARSLRALRAINDSVRTDLERGKQIGHSYLLGADTAADVREAWRYEILPLLEEYYYGRFDRLRSVAFDGGGDRLFTDDGRIADFDAADLHAELGRF